MQNMKIKALLIEGKLAVRENNTKLEGYKLTKSALKFVTTGILSLHCPGKITLEVLSVVG